VEKGLAEGPRDCALRCEAVNCTFATADERYGPADGQFIAIVVALPNARR